MMECRDYTQLKDQKDQDCDEIACEKPAGNSRRLNKKEEGQHSEVNMMSMQASSPICSPLHFTTQESSPWTVTSWLSPILVDISQRVLHSRLKTFLFSKSILHSHPSLAIPLCRNLNITNRSLPHLTCGTNFLLLFVFLISSILHHHSALLHCHTLIMDRLLTFLVAFSILVLNLFFSQTPPFHSHASIYRCLSLICWCLTVSDAGGVAKCRGTAGFSVHYNVVIRTYVVGY